MLDSIDLERKLSKEEYNGAKEGLAMELASLQRRIRELGIPVIVVFEGWEASGKGTAINELILPLDPRGFTVKSIKPPTEEERMRPFLWRFWMRTPLRGRLAIFDRSWYSPVLGGRVEEEKDEARLEQAYQDIRSFERQLNDDGCVIIKFFMHISKSEQRRRFEKLEENPSTAWRVTKDDWKAHKKYRKYLSAVEDMLSRTDSEFAPWTIVEAHDRRFAHFKMFNTVVDALKTSIEKKERAQEAKKAEVKAKAPARHPELNVSILDGVDLSSSLSEEDYRQRLKKGQERLRDLEHEIYMRRVPVVIAYEGWDAAGKGGNIKRLTQTLDPRGYEVMPVAAPNDIEKGHHYLWRFWIQMPKAGHITIFDRTWYGRVLVERIEGFCSEAEWKRAYREINEMEAHMTAFGAVIIKFWLHVSPEEQLKRFEERQQLEHKKWKITDEDWRNREKWGQYKAAVDEMLFRTSTPLAPWTVVESNCKFHARIKSVETVIDSIERRLKDR